MSNAGWHPCPRGCGTEHMYEASAHKCCLPEEPPRACTNCGQPRGEDTLCSFCTSAHQAGADAVRKSILERLERKGAWLRTLAREQLSAFVRELVLGEGDGGP